MSGQQSCGFAFIKYGSKIPLTDPDPSYNRNTYLGWSRFGHLSYVYMLLNVLSLLFLYRGCADPTNFEKEEEKMRIWFQGYGSGSATLLKSQFCHLMQALKHFFVLLGRRSVMQRIKCAYTASGWSQMYTFCIIARLSLLPL